MPLPQRDLSRHTPPAAPARVAFAHARIARPAGDLASRRVIDRQQLEVT